MTEKEKKELKAEHDALYNAMLTTTTPILCEARNPFVAIDALAHYTQSMLLAICVSGGLPVRDSFDMILKHIGKIDNIEHWERVVKEKNEQRKIIKQSAAIIGMDGKPIKKGGAQ